MLGYIPFCQDTICQNNSLYYAAAINSFSLYIIEDMIKRSNLRRKIASALECMKKNQNVEPHTILIDTKSNEEITRYYTEEIVQNEQENIW